MEKLVLSQETLQLIEEFERKERKVRKSQISCKDKNEINDFIKLLISRYVEICNEATVNLIKRNQKRQLTNNVRNKYIQYRFKLTNSDYNEIEKILSTNKFDGRPEVSYINGKMVKRYDAYRIKRISRILYTASELGQKYIDRLIVVPDIHFIMIQIKNDQFGELKEYLGTNIEEKCALDISDPVLTSHEIAI